MTEFGKLSPDGYEHVGTLDQSAMLKCPFFIIEFEHYRTDGTCKCDDPAEQARLIREYDYTLESFANSV
jgi:hypothetical protein